MVDKRLGLRAGGMSQDSSSSEITFVLSILAKNREHLNISWEFNHIMRIEIIKKSLCEYRWFILVVGLSSFTNLSPIQDHSIAEERSIILLFLTGKSHGLFLNAISAAVQYSNNKYIWLFTKPLDSLVDVTVMKIFVDNPSVIVIIIFIDAAMTCVVDKRKNRLGFGLYPDIGHEVSPLLIEFIWI